jgi:hypothetical protein
MLHSARMASAAEIGLETTAVHGHSFKYLHLPQLMTATPCCKQFHLRSFLIVSLAHLGIFHSNMERFSDNIREGRCVLPYESGSSRVLDLVLYSPVCYCSD